MASVTSLALRAAAVVAVVALAGCGQKPVTVSSAPRRSPAQPTRVAPTGGPAPAASVAADPVPAPAPVGDVSPAAKPVETAVVSSTQPRKRAAAARPLAQVAPVARDAPVKARRLHGDALWGRGFAATSVRENGRERELVAGGRLEVAFEQRATRDGMRWRSGCNTAGAAVVATAKRLLVELDEGGTSVGCSDAAHAQDEWFDGFFDADPYWSLRGRVLRLTSGDVVIELEETQYW